MAVWLSWAITSLRRAAWAPISVLMLHVVAVQCFDIYSRFPDFDMPMHFVGGAAIAHFFVACYRSASERELLGQPAAVVFPPMILGLTCLAAVVWEFAEFAGDRCSEPIPNRASPTRCSICCWDCWEGRS